MPIGEWVLRTACADARKWHARRPFPSLTVSVNLSSRQFQQADLVRQVTSALAESGLDADKLDLEITESNAMQNAEHSITTLRGLKKQGVRISMDDFGTGYSSLNYLKRFPIDRIKLDQSFVRDLPGDKDDAAIAMAVIAMGRSLELIVIAEGVETEEQLAFLKDGNVRPAPGLPALPAARAGGLRDLPPQSRHAPEGVWTASAVPRALIPGALDEVSGGPGSVRMPVMEAKANPARQRFRSIFTPAKPQRASREFRDLLGLHAAATTATSSRPRRSLSRKKTDPRAPSTPTPCARASPCRTPSASTATT